MGDRACGDIILPQAGVDDRGEDEHIGGFGFGGGGYGVERKSPHSGGRGGGRAGVLRIGSLERHIVRIGDSIADLPADDFGGIAREGRAARSKGDGNVVGEISIRHLDRHQLDMVHGQRRADRRFGGFAGERRCAGGGEAIAIGNGDDDRLLGAGRLAGGADEVASGDGGKRRKECERKRCARTRAKSCDNTTSFDCSLHCLPPLITN